MRVVPRSRDLMVVIMWPPLAQLFTKRATLQVPGFASLAANDRIKMIGQRLASRRALRYHPATWCLVSRPAAAGPAGSYQGDKCRPNLGTERKARLATVRRHN